MKNISPDIRVGAVLIAALAWCGAILAVRILWTRSFDYGFLVSNLALASIPIVFSTLIVWQRNWVVRGFLGFFWLLFLPNAPYMITDFIHIRFVDSGPIWLDVLMMASCAATGLALGYCSLMQIQALFTRAQKPRLGWLFAASVLFLSGFGIYLGRFLRWHSTDFVRDPLSLLGQVAKGLTTPWIHSRAWAVTLGFGAFLFIGYTLLVVIGQANKNGAANGSQPSR